MNSQMLEAANVVPAWLALAAIGVAVISYFLGCFNGAVVVSRYILRNDIRQHGSGNAGLTNFYRVFGGPLTLVVILSDVMKAVLAVLFASFIAEQISPELIVLAEYWAGAFCMIGHMFPCTFQFRGGKGVLSGSAVAIMIGMSGGGVLPSWIIPLTVWLGFIVLVAATRYVSLGSCWGGASFIVVSWLVYQDSLVLLLATVMGGLLLWGHRGNMVRLVKGTERKFEFRKKGAAPGAEAEKPSSEVKADETSQEEAEERPAEEPEQLILEEEPEPSAPEEANVIKLELSAPEETPVEEPEFLDPEEAVEDEPEAFDSEEALEEESEGAFEGGFAVEVVEAPVPKARQGRKPVKKAKPPEPNGKRDKKPVIKSRAKAPGQAEGAPAAREESGSEYQPRPRTHKRKTKN